MGKSVNKQNTHLYLTMILFRIDIAIVKISMESNKIYFAIQEHTVKNEWMAHFRRGKGV